MTPAEQTRMLVLQASIKAIMRREADQPHHDPARLADVLANLWDLHREILYLLASPEKRREISTAVTNSDNLDSKGISQ